MTRFPTSAVTAAPRKRWIVRGWVAPAALATCAVILGFGVAGGWWR